MKNKILMRTLVVGMSIFILTGCGTSNDAGTNQERETKDTQIENDKTGPEKKETSDGNDTNDVGANDKTDAGKKETSDGNDTNNAGANDKTNPGNKENAVGSGKGSEILAASDLKGTVIEFSDNECIINPVTENSDGEGGSSAVIAAEGYEDEGEKVTVKYADNCVFERAVMSITTGTATTSEATISDIKKKTSLALYGDFIDTENFTALKKLPFQEL